MARGSPSVKAEPGSSSVRILFFGRVADRFGRETEFDLPPAGCSVAELREALVEGDAEAAGALSARLVRACVDQVVVADSFRVLPGQEIAFIPPVSGG